MKKIQDSSASSTRPAVIASGTVGWFRHANALTKTKATKVTVDWLNDLQGSFMDLFTRTGITATGGEAGDRNLYDAIMALVSPKIDQTTGDARYVKKAGDTMTGLLTLSGDPATNLHASTKQYADTKFAKSGGTVSGAMTVTGAVSLNDDLTMTNAARTVILSKHPTLAMHAATKDYTDRAMPSGARLLFAMMAAPTGWTRDTGDLANNRMLRVVSSGTGNTGAGTDSPILNDKVPSHTHAFTTGGFNTAHAHVVSGNTGIESNDHTHLFPSSGDSNAAPSVGGVTTGHSYTRATFGASANHTHQISLSTDTQGGIHSHTGTTNANGSPANWSPRYLDLILCTKD